MEWFLKVVRDNYANFEGRARRKEYWMFVLVVALINIGIGIVALILGSISSTLGGIVYALSYIVSLALLVPSLAVLARRLHDTGKPTWYIVLAFIPFVNFYILYLALIEGDRGPNEFGPDPKADENADPFANQRPSEFGNTQNPESDNNNTF